MHHRNSTFFQPSGPCLRITGRSKDDFHSFFDHDIHHFFYLRIHQWNIHSERQIGSSPTFSNVLTQNFGMHRPSTNKSQPSGITYCRRQTPTTAPYHTSLNNRITNTQKSRNSIHKSNLFIFIFPSPSLYGEAFHFTNSTNSPFR